MKGLSPVKSIQEGVMHHWPISKSMKKIPSIDKLGIDGVNVCPQNPSQVYHGQIRSPGRSTVLARDSTAVVLEPHACRYGFLGNNRSHSKFV